MKNIFSYDSKLMNLLGVIGDTMLLNLLFLLCCVPVVTIGAAVTALYSGCRAITRDEPCFRAFFKGFRSGLLRSIAAWLIELAAILLFLWIAWVIWANKFGGYLPAFLVSVLVLALLLSVTNMTFLFFSAFECSLPRLLKNGLYMTLGYLLRGLLMGIAMWLPVLLFLLLPDTFLQLAVVWLLFYFGAVANLCVRLMKKPFARLAEGADLISGDKPEGPSEAN